MLSPERLQVGAVLLLIKVLARNTTQLPIKTDDLYPKVSEPSYQQGWLARQKISVKIDIFIEKCRISPDN